LLPDFLRKLKLQAAFSRDRLNDRSVKLFGFAAKAQDNMIGLDWLLWVSNQQLRRLIQSLAVFGTGQKDRSAGRFFDGCLEFLHQPIR